MSSDESNKFKQIRSFILRQGRITVAQQHALDLYSKKYCLDPAIEYDFQQVFGRTAPLCLEIGFGNGDSLVQIATANPEKDYIGIEVHRPGVGHLIMNLEQQNLKNVRIYCHDAIEIIEQRLFNDCLDAVHLFFPDPWPKKKHHKRRIVNDRFIELLGKKLKSGAYFHAATDWQNYAESMLALLSASNSFSNQSPSKDYCERPDYRTRTKFEQRGIRLGHGVWDLIFTKL
jgi:tRNA (guanine-N7-)-methyltransferase